jgi:hypothetical protein
MVEKHVMFLFMKGKFYESAVFKVLDCVQALQCVCVFVCVCVCLCVCVCVCVYRLSVLKHLDHRFEFRTEDGYI